MNNQYPPQMYPPQQNNMYPPQQNNMYPPPPPPVVCPPPPVIICPPMQQVDQQRVPMDANRSPCPTIVKCPTCNHVGTTVMTPKAGSGTYTMCFILCLFTGCCCIPFCIDSCQDKVHTCSKCKNVVGVHEYKVC